MATGSSQIDNIVSFIANTWGIEIPPERAQRWADELASGSGRSYEELRGDIFKFVVTDERVDEWVRAAFEERGMTIATGAETEQERIDRISDELQSGKRTFVDFTSTLDGLSGPAGTAEVGTQTIPQGMRLVRAGDEFYLVGDAYGAQFGYLIGSEDDVIDTYGSLNAFDGYDSIGDIGTSDIIVAGTDDELLGAEESLQAMFDRDMRAAGLEGVPEWITADKTAFTIYAAGVAEGWSAERSWQALSGTDAFKSRFSGLDVVMEQLGTDGLTEGIAEYTARESEIRNYLLAYRGSEADTSREYVSSLIGAGWSAEQVGEVLSAERQFKDNPEAFENLNEILAFQGLPEMSPDDFVSFLTEGNRALADPEFQPTELFEAVNDALRFQALLAEGVEGLSVEFVSGLGEADGADEAIGSVQQFSQQARLAAQYLAGNRAELDANKYGLTREDVVAAMFGEESSSGKSVTDITQALEKFGRERSYAQRGYAAAQTYIDAAGRLRVQGYSQL